MHIIYKNINLISYRVRFFLLNVSILLLFLSREQTILFFFLDVVQKDLKSTLRILYSLFQKYKNVK